jgi:hypothetical protein
VLGARLQDAPGTRVFLNVSHLQRPGRMALLAAEAVGRLSASDFADVLNELRVERAARPNEAEQILDVNPAFRTQGLKGPYALRLKSILEPTSHKTASMTSCFQIPSGARTLLFPCRGTRQWSAKPPCD